MATRTKTTVAKLADLEEEDQDFGLSKNGRGTVSTPGLRFSNDTLDTYEDMGLAKSRRSERAQTTKSITKGKSEDKSCTEKCLLF